jgi:CheY-like chemotaxis protein
MPKILVVDDEVGIRELLSEILRDEGHDVQLAENAAEARAAREWPRARPGAARHLDARHRRHHAAQGMGGQGQLNMPVVMMSGHGTIDTAVEATRIGALDFLEKPIALQKLLAAVKTLSQCLQVRPGWCAVSASWRACRARSRRTWPSRSTAWSATTCAWWWPPTAPPRGACRRRLGGAAAGPPVRGLPGAAGPGRDSATRSPRSPARCCCTWSKRGGARCGAFPPPPSTPCATSLAGGLRRAQGR